MGMKTVHQISGYTVNIFDPDSWMPTAKEIFPVIQLRQ